MSIKYPFKLAEDLIPVLAAYKKQQTYPEGTKMELVFRQALINGASQNMVQSNETLTVENKYFTNKDDVKIQLRVYTPVTEKKNLPCLYWIHGGGTMSGLPEQDDQPISQLARIAGCVVVSVNYRLAPENPYPKPVNDCYEGLEYIYNNPEEFGVDNQKIAVGGASAGGMLTASCVIMARDRKGPKIVHQSLTYPMLDHRGLTDSSHEITNVGVWDRDMNLYGWQCYLSGVSENIPEAAVPMLARDLSGLPQAFLAVGTMDVLRDETIEYSQKLSAAGVPTELHVYPGMVHVFDALAPTSKEAVDFSAARVSALLRAFAD